MFDSQKIAGSPQSLLACGLLSRSGVNSPQSITVFQDIGDIDQLVCSKTMLLALTKSGLVYKTSINLDPQQVKIRSFLLYLIVNISIAWFKGKCSI